MCDPITLIGVGLSAAGGAMRASAETNYRNTLDAENLKAFKISQKARKEERARQRVMEGEANDTFVSTLGSMDRSNFDADRAANADNFVATLAAQPAVMDEATRLAGQNGANSAVKDRIALSMNKAATDARERVKNLAELLSYGETGTKRTELFGRSGDAMSTLGGLRRGSLGVSQLEQTIPAANVQKGSTLFADILSGTGGILSGGGFGLGTTAPVNSSLAPISSVRPMPRPVI